MNGAPPRTAELAVVGAGPAGVEAAVTAAGYGVDVVLIDEQPAPGGQVYRAAPGAFPARGRVPGPDEAAGDAMRARLAASPVEARAGERVWSVVARAGIIASAPFAPKLPGPEPGPAPKPDRAPSPSAPPAFDPAPDLETETEAMRRETGLPSGGDAWFRLDTVGADGPRTVLADCIVLAPGAVERVVPFPGWTLPGVIGLGAATVLLKSQRLLPGRRVVVAGAGPLVPAVAAAIVKAGGTVAAVADLAGPSDWLRALPRLAAMPRLLGRGAGWLVRIAGARVPILFRHSVRSAAGRRALEEVTVAPVGPDGSWRGGAPGDATGGGQAMERRIEADALAVGHGLAPATEIARLLRLRHRFSRAEGGWLPETDLWGQTSLAGCHAAGDAAGVHGAAAAAHSGRAAGISAALYARRIRPDVALARVRRARRGHARAARFGAAMGRLAALPPALVVSMPADTVVCRCEDVTRREIEEAVAQGAREVNQLKHFTRCGMGPCQGRVCGEAAAELLAARIAGDPDEGRRAAGQWTGRAPLRPVAMDDLVGRFDYRDIPVPPPAPL